MDTLKPFDPDDIDESLTRIVTRGSDTYLLFPYLDALAALPKFNSIGRVIHGPAATVDDFAALAAAVKSAARQAEWFISFNTPWLVKLSEAQSFRHRAIARTVRRD